MSAIHDLIAQISDPPLRERLAAEWASAAREKKFGLVFEDHLPELLPLHGTQLIRKQRSAGGEHFVRLEINQSAMVKKLLPITSNPQLDALFAAVAG